RAAGRAFDQFTQQTIGHAYLTFTAGTSNDCRHKYSVAFQETGTTQPSLHDRGAWLLMATSPRSTLPRYPPVGPGARILGLHSSKRRPYQAKSEHPKHPQNCTDQTQRPPRPSRAEAALVHELRSHQSQIVPSHDPGSEAKRQPQDAENEAEK